MTNEQGRPRALFGRIVPPAHHQTFVACNRFDPSLQGQPWKIANFPNAGVGGDGSGAGAWLAHTKIHLTRHGGAHAANGLTGDGIQTEAVHGPERRQSSTGQIGCLGTTEGSLLIDFADLRLADGATPESEVVQLNGAAR